MMQASDGRVSIFGHVTHLGGGSYSVDYYPETVGSYLLKVYMGSDVKIFALFVHPGTGSPQQFALSGSALRCAHVCMPVRVYLCIRV